MQLFYCLLFGSVVCALSSRYNPEEAVKTEFQLNLYDLQDRFDDKAEATREAYLKKSFHRKELLEKELGDSFKQIKKNLSNFTDIPEDIHKEWLLLNRPGDYALPKEAWNELVTFSNLLEKFHEGINVSCTNVSSSCVVSKQELLDTLETSRNLTDLQTKWSTWQNVLSKEQNKYSSILQLLNNASEANEQLNVNGYWEMLSDYNNGFLVSEQLWSEVKPLYEKLRTFVKKRLYSYYDYSDENFNETDAFPIYMTGSLLGDDWSNIADIILPRPYLFYDAKTFLHTKSSKQIFEHAETITTRMNFPELPRKFWTSSTFNHTSCANQLLTFREDQHTEVLTCSSNSWKQYLEAHEIVMKAILRDMEYDVFPLTELRSSAFDEAIVGLSAFFAINAMDKVGVVREIDVEQEKEMYQKDKTLLLLTALRVLPKLAFYYAADKWRLSALESDSKSLEESWENIRQEIQGLKGINSEEYDFLNDEYFISNKPYLSKFIGIFLQFQIIDYFKTYEYDESESAFGVITSDTFLYNVVTNRLNSEWQNLISNHFGINEITAEPLLNYFTPLNEYLENVTNVFITPPPFTTQPSTVSTTTTTTVESTKRSAFTLESSGDVTTTEIVAVDVNETVTTIKPIVKGKHSEKQQQNAGMYAGLTILISVAVIVTLILIRNKMVKKRKRNNNRRYET